ELSCEDYFSQRDAHYELRFPRCRAMEKSTLSGDDEAGKPPCGEVSGLLRAWGDGDRGALDRLTPIVYGELRRLGKRDVRGGCPGHIQQTTALLNEAYIRLVDYRAVRWQNCSHFFALSAQLMLRILVVQSPR